MKISIIKTFRIVIIFSAFLILTLSCRKSSEEENISTNCITENVESQFTILAVAFTANPNTTNCNKLKNYLQTTVSKCSGSLPANVLSTINAEIAKIDCSALTINPLCNPTTIETQFTNLVLGFVANPTTASCNNLKKYIESILSACLSTLPKETKDEISLVLASLDCSSI